MLKELETARTYEPIYEGEILLNGEELAPNIYMDALPRNGKIRKIQDRMYLAGNTVENITDLNADNTHFKHVYVKSGSVSFEITGTSVELQAGDVLHLGPEVEITFTQSLDDNTSAEFLTILHDPQDISPEVKEAYKDKWEVRKNDQTTFGYWIGGFVKGYEPAQTSELAVGTKFLTSNVNGIYEGLPHTHKHQFELNSVLKNSYTVGISSSTSRPQSVQVEENTVLVVGQGDDSGTQNIHTSPDGCLVFLIQTPNLQQAPLDPNLPKSFALNRTYTADGMPVKSPLNSPRRYTVQPFQTTNQ